MNRLEIRVNNLEATNDVSDDELHPIFLVRTTLDQYGQEMKRDFKMHDHPPLLIPPPPERDPLEPDEGPALPYLAAYRDDPICMSRDQFRRLFVLVSNKSRTVPQIPFTKDERKQLDALWLEISENVPGDTARKGVARSHFIHSTKSGIRGQDRGLGEQVDPWQ